MKSFGRRAGRALALAALATTTAAQAQAVQDQSVPESSLDIPANLQIFGKLDPNVRKPTAIVNDTVVTGTDVDQRLALIAFYNNVPVAKVTGDERDRLRLQILRQLIDETLQIQEAKASDITVTEAEINQAVARTAQSSFHTTAAQLPDFLRKVGASDRTLKREIEAELAWQRYLRRKIEPTTNVGDAEVKGILDRLKAAQGTQEFNIQEIFLRADASNEQQVFANARAMLAEIQKGQRPFGDFARQYSEASTKGTGGDLGWVRANTLPDELAQAAQGMQVGQVAGPIENSGGFSILYLTDKRQVLTADPRNAKLSLKQLTIKFPPNTTQADATARASAFATGLRAIHGCGTVEKSAGALGAEVVDNDAVLVRQLPAQLQEIVLKMQIGEATPPFGNPQEGVRALVLCGRDDTQAAQLPRADQVQDQLEQTRVNLRAQQKLRDLRRDAVIEYR
ncbi:peptidylprolyl isomerase [uncultured Sphingomonas sp.]|uniref:peptidylprolyl isomerase n=1 Tax=uncultured Sphingomonas sp. TaxID=158754 RepID=UPI0035CA334E